MSRNDLKTDETKLVTGEGAPEVPPRSDDWGDTVPAASQAADDWGMPQTPLPQLSTLVIEQHGGNFQPDIVKMLVYGESGAGKTRFASTWPGVIFADIDKGMASVTEKVMRVPIDDANGSSAWDKMKALYKYLSEEEHPYQTVVLDTLNEMQRIAMHMTIEEFTMVRRSYGNLPSQSDYGKMLHDMVELTRDFIALPMRVLLLAQVNSRQFDTDTLMPQLVGKNTAREIARKMDVIGYIYKSENEDGEGHKLSEMSFDAVDYVTKDRSFKLPSSLVNPTYARVVAFWEQNEKEK